jgi:hypothetical protein
VQRVVHRHGQVVRFNEHDGVRLLGAPIASRLR